VGQHISNADGHIQAAQQQLRFLLPRPAATTQPQSLQQAANHLDASRVELQAATQQNGTVQAALAKIQLQVDQLSGQVEKLNDTVQQVVCSPKMVPSDMRVSNRPLGPERTLHERQEAHSRTDHRQAAGGR
jgi:hypothetical protein